MTLRAAVWFVSLALVLVPPCASAGSFGVEAQGGYFSMSATKSAQAVFDGSTGGGAFGGGPRDVIPKGFYIAAGGPPPSPNRPAPCWARPARGPGPTGG